MSLDQFKNLPTSSDLNLIANYYGKATVRFARADNMHEGIENNKHFGPLEIDFEDGSCLTFDISGDAESIERISASAIYFGESEEDRKNYWTEIILKDGDWLKLIGARLIKASLLKNSFQEREWICGCKLNFDNGHSLTYFNYFDDAKVAFDNDEFLLSFIKFEKLQWVN